MANIKNKENIDNIKMAAIEILKKYNVKNAAFFGSILKDGFDKAKDIDIVIEFKNRQSLLDLVSLKFELEKSLNKDVDIMTYKSLHPIIKKEVINTQERIL